MLFETESEIIPVNKNHKMIIYTDGACSGNPGPGGWCSILLYNNQEKILRGSDPNTTNNKMELLSVIEALDIFKYSLDIIIYTDSQYVIDGITKWIHKWKNNSWKTSKKEPVKNLELWIRLDSVVSKHKIEWKWVKGHSGNHYNEKANDIAQSMCHNK